MPLAAGLGVQRVPAERLLHRILYWTHGHPYLTQRLCRAVGDDASITDASGVDRACEALFFSPRAQERDDNLLFVRERLLRSEADPARLLDLYARVRRGRRVGDDDTNRAASLLRLSGIAQANHGHLHVRNRIYERVFDQKWVTQHLPDAELRRQRAAYRRGLLRASAIAATVLAVTIGLALTAVYQARSADQQRRLAEERERTGRRYLYVAQMNLAQQSWEEGNLARARELLDGWWPQAGQEDLRGYEWRFLWRLCQETARFTFPRQPQSVSSVAFSPDGHTLAASSASIVYLWNVRARDQHPPGGWIASLREHTHHVNQVTFSPDGKTLASCSDDGVVKLWDVARRVRVATLPRQSGPVLAIAFSPDGRTLALAGKQQTIRLWDVATRKETVRLRTESAASSSVAFAPDGRVLASAVGVGAVQLWNLTGPLPGAGGHATTTFRGHASAVNAIAFAPDGRLLASASDDGTVNLWDPVLKREIGTLSGHRAAVNSLAFSPSGKTLVTGSGDQTVRLWDLATRREMMSFQGHRGPVNTVAFSRDGRTIASGDDDPDKTIKLWDAAARDDTVIIVRAEEAAPRKHGPASAIALSPDDKTLAAAHLDGTVELWEIARGRAEGGRAHGIQAPDEDLAGAAGRAPEPRVKAGIQAHTATIVALQFSPNGKILATGSQDRTVKLWDVATWRRLAILRGFTGNAYGLAWAPNGKILAVRSSDGVKLWDLATQRSVATLEASGTWPSQGGLGVAFTPDGKLLAAGNGFGRVTLWDTSGWRVAATLKGRADDPPVFSPDGRMLACNWQNTVALWDLAGRRVVATLRGHAAGSGDLAFSPDGKTLAVTSANTITLYNTAVRQPVATLKGHTGPVTSVAFSHDGATLVSAAGDGTIRLWRAATWQAADQLYLSASGADRRVLLQWSQSSAEAYNVYRGPAGASRAQLTKLNREPVQANAYLDQSPRLVNGRTRTYAVAGLFRDANGQIEEGHRVMAPATPVVAPPGFSGCSINEGGLTGSALFDAAAGRITIFGAGVDVWEDADGLYFLSQPVVGDFQITVEALTRPTGNWPFAQAGLMVRESLDEGARNSFLPTSARRGLQHKWRATAGDRPDADSVVTDAALKLPILLPTQRTRAEASNQRVTRSSSSPRWQRRCMRGSRSRPATRQRSARRDSGTW